MSELSKQLRGRTTLQRAMPIEPYNHFQVSPTLMEVIEPCFDTSTEFEVSVKWYVNFTLSPEVNTEAQKQRCREMAIDQFNREVYGEFEPILFEMERELMNYMGNEKLMKLLSTIRQRMFNE